MEKLAVPGKQEAAITIEVAMHEVAVLRVFVTKIVAGADMADELVPMTLHCALAPFGSLPVFRYFLQYRTHQPLA